MAQFGEGVGGIVEGAAGVVGDVVGGVVGGVVQGAAGVVQGAAGVVGNVVGGAAGVVGDVVGGLAGVAVGGAAAVRNAGNNNDSSSVDADLPPAPEVHAEEYFHNARDFVVDFSGEKHVIDEHDITINIPAGAINPGETVKFSRAVALFGPFTYSTSTRPISAVLKICPVSHPNLVLNKPMEVTIPHYLTYLEEEDYKKYDITFAKADHTSTFRPLRKKRGEVEMHFIKKGNQGYGILHSTHCCCFCITSYGGDQTKLKEQTLKAGYCLTRLETPFRDHETTVDITFFVSFMLPTCLKALKSQFPRCAFSVKYYMFRLANDSTDSDPTLKIVIRHQSRDYEVVCVDPRNSDLENLQIRSSQVEFWSKRDQLELLQETEQYPPRIKVTVCLHTDTSHRPVTFPTRFEGCTEDSIRTLNADVPLLRPCDSALTQSHVSQAQRGADGGCSIL